MFELSKLGMLSVVILLFPPQAPNVCKKFCLFIVYDQADVSIAGLYMDYNYP